MKSFFKHKKNNKIGIALGSGGAKGIAHIGILEILEKNGLFPSEISGCSIGAIIGALYASGLGIEKIKKIALNINIFKLIELFDFSDPRKGGIVKGEMVENFLDKILPVKKFKDLQIPFKCIATDIKSRKGIVFSKGSLIPAIRASISIPGLFIPYDYQNKSFIDGCFVNPIPVNLLSKSKYRIAVIVQDYNFLKTISKQTKLLESRVNNLIQDTFIPGLKLLPDIKNRSKKKKTRTIDILSSTLDIISKELINYNINDEDVNLILKPKVQKIPVLAFYKGKKSYKEGIHTIKQYISVIKSDLQR